MATRDIPRTLGHSFIDTITISADGSESFPARWKGWYLTQVHILTSVDDAIDVAINQHNGGEWGSVTTTAATSGEYMPNNAASGECRYITGTGTITVANMSSGTVTLECVLTQ